MELEKIKDIVGDLPNMSLQRAKMLKTLIDEEDINNILELGCNHGVSTCYMAGIIHSRGKGSITTIDRYSAKKKKPNIFDLLKKTQLTNYVTCYFEQTSMDWRLMKIIEQNKNPIYDFCYFDAGHNWHDTGFAFFLVDRLLRPGGWVLFDDLDWTYAKSTILKNTEKVKQMREEERDTPQVLKVFELLVKRHPSYGKFKVYGNKLGLAKKII